MRKLDGALKRVSTADLAQFPEQFSMVPRLCQAAYAETSIDQLRFGVLRIPMEQVVIRWFLSGEAQYILALERRLRRTIRTAGTRNDA